MHAEHRKQDLTCVIPQDILLPALLSPTYMEGHSHCSPETTAAEGTTLTGTERSPVILYRVITVWRELGKQNENDLQQSSNSVFNQEIKWCKHDIWRNKTNQGVFFLHTLFFLGVVQFLWK